MPKVAITYYKNEQAAIDIANEINADVNIYQLDNSDSKSVEDTYKNVIKDYGSINTLVNACRI
jgi:short-subunit dehydrogenase